MNSNQLDLRPISTKKSVSFGSKTAAARERSSLANASFRLYYSLQAGAVPFLWESAPGTPKSGARATAVVSPAEMASIVTELLPPISPRPSYQSPELKARRRRCRARSWPAAAPGGVLRALLGVLGLRKR